MQNAKKRPADVDMLALLFVTAITTADVIYVYVTKDVTDINMIN